MASWLGLGLSLTALWLLNFIDDKLPKARYRDLTIRRIWEKGCVERTLERLKRIGLKINDVGYHRTGDLTTVDIDVRVAFPSKLAMEDLEKEFADYSTCELLALRQALERFFFSQFLPACYNSFDT